MNNTEIILDRSTKFPKPRIWELDFLRGVSILLMCFDHLFFDIYYIFGDWRSSGSAVFNKLYQIASFYLGYHDESIIIEISRMQIAEYVFLWFILLAVIIKFAVDWVKNKGKFDKKEARNYGSAFVSIAICISALAIVHRFSGYYVFEGNSLREFIHVIVLWIFFILCGIGCRFTKSNIKRAFLIAVCAGAVSLATIFGEEVLGIEGIAVRYGVLHMLATAVFIYAIIELVCKMIVKDEEKRKYVISIVCIVIGIAVYASYQYLWNAADVTKSYYLAFYHYRLGKGFVSSDWFTLSENLHRVLFGAAIAPFVYPQKTSYIPELNVLNKGAFCFLGRKTLWIVLLHQIIIYLVLTIFNSFAF